MKNAAEQSTSGSVGGASNEVGSGHRAGVAAHIVVAALTGGKVPELLSVGHESSLASDSERIPSQISLETDDPTDDINVTLVDGSRILIQAKVSGSFALLKNVLTEQWIPSLQQDSSERPLSLVFATERINPELLRLQEGWRRRQSKISTFPSKPERKVLEKWDSAVATALSVVPEVDRAALTDRLADSVVIAEIQARSPRGIHRQLQLERLRSIIPTRQQEALEAITGEILNSAQNRSGGTAAMWTQFLLSRGFEILTDPHGRPASQIAAEEEAIQAYRDHLAEGFNRVTVPNIEGPVLRLVVNGLAAGITVSYAVGDDDRQFDHDLFPAVRSNRRSFIVGEGGSGKSEALRQLAAFAANPKLARQTDKSMAEVWPDLGSSAPLPVLVDLKSLIPADPAAPVVITFETISKAAVRPVQTDFLSSAAAGISRALRSGTALLLVDGLDECRARMNDVVVALTSFLHLLPRDTTAVLSGRPSSQADAQGLGFTVLNLVESRTLSETRDAILRQLAENSGVQNVQEWVAERIDWFLSETRHHSELFSNPLMAILATIVAGNAADADHLPRGRARLVKVVLDHYMESWESRHRRNGDLKISILDPSTAVKAIKESFLVVAHNLDIHMQIPRDQIEAAVRRVLLARYVSAPAVAESGAEQIISAWLDSGILTANGSLLAPRLRLFAEAGEALHASARPDTLAEWVAARIDDSALHGQLLLAAELTPLVLDPALQAVEASLDDLGLLTVRATGAWAIIRTLERGAAPDALAHISSGTARLFDALGTASQRAATAAAAASLSRPSALASSDWPLWRAMELILGIGTRQQIVGFIDEIVRGLSTEYLRILGSALVEKRLSFVGPLDRPPTLAEVDEKRESVLSRTPALWEELVGKGRTKAPTDPRHRRSLEALFASARYDFLVTLAANLLLPVRPDLAVSIAALTERMGGGEAKLIREVVWREGYSGLLVDHEEALMTEMALRQEQMCDVEEDAWLQSLADGAEGAEDSLTGAQRWHLDAIGQLVGLYRLNSLKSGEHEWAFKVSSAEHRALDDVAMRLLGLDPCVVGAQAAQLLRSGAGAKGRNSRRLITLLQSEGEYRADWARSDSIDSDRATILSALSTSLPMFAIPSCLLLYGHPDPGGTSLLLEEAFPKLYGWAQYEAAVFACDLGDVDLLRRCFESSVPALRAAAGRFVRDSTQHEEMRQQLQNDIDLTVRGAVAIAQIDTEGRWGGEPATQALCLHCGHVNEVTSKCASCGSNIPTAF